MRFGLRSRVFLGVALFATAVGIVLYVLNPLNLIELQTVNTRFQIRGNEPPPRSLVVVAVDQQTFHALGLQWPFPRAVWARALGNVLRDRPKAVAVDVQFSEKSTLGGNDDYALLNALYGSNGKVVLANDNPTTVGDATWFGKYDNKLMRYLHVTPADATFPNDADGLIRRIFPSVSRLVGFDLATAQVATGHRIHVPPGTTPWLDYYGPPGTVPAVSFSQVYLNKLPRGYFHDKIVVMGATEETLQDVHETPESHGTLMSGAEIHAQAIGTVLAGFPLSHVGKALDILLIVLAATVVPLTSLRLPFKAELAVMIAALAALLVGTQLAFNAGHIVPFVYPVIALLIAVVGSLEGFYVLRGVEQARVHDLFARFVPSAVVDQVIDRTDKDLRLGAVRREGTVMFTDLRGFTSFAESLAPERVVQVINQYLGGMTETILDYGGTLVSFMGDGIFALWGAPLEMEDHADRALAAARTMLAERLPAFNAWLAEQGYEHAFRMGIGLNSGPVMSGNVGSERRLEYAAIGDTTNTSSRLEGMTKGTPHQLFISESTRLALHVVPEDLIFVDEFEIRGRQAKLKVWSLPDAASGQPAADAPAAPSEPKIPAA